MDDQLREAIVTFYRTMRKKGWSKANVIHMASLRFDVKPGVLKAFFGQK